MKKIPTLFERDETVKGRPVIDKIKPECAWVLAGEGQATIKLDGTNVKIEAGTLYKRQKPTSGDYDEASYVPADRNDPNDKYLWEAFDMLPRDAWLDGVYECIGPRIQGNPEKYPRHTLIMVCPPSPEVILRGWNACGFQTIKTALASLDIEGIVFHRDPADPNCDKAKIKKRDFGMKR